MSLDMQTTLSELLALGRDIWGPPTMTLDQVAICANVVAGDLARAARDGGNLADVERELGNLILSAIRWADDLGFDVGDCLAAAEAAQRAYVQREAAR